MLLDRVRLSLSEACALTVNSPCIKRKLSTEEWQEVQVALAASIEIDMGGFDISGTNVDRCCESLGGPLLLPP